MEDLNKNTGENMEQQEPKEERKQQTAAQEAGPQQGAQKGGGKKKTIWKQPWLWIIIVIIIGAGIVYATGGMKALSNMTPATGNNGESQGGQVVATVNGKKITSNELDARVMQLKQSMGTSTPNISDKQLKKQALTGLVEQSLVAQEAKKQNITVSDKELQKAYGQVVNRFKDKQAFEKAIKNQGLTKSDLKSNLRPQLVRQKYINNNINTEKVNITEKQITQAYNKIKSQRKGNIPPLKQVKPQLKQRLKQQQRSQLINKLINKLKKKANISKNL